MGHLRTMHIGAAALGAILIASFWSSAALALLLRPAAYGTVHHWIVNAIPWLIATEVVAGVTGRKLAGRRRGGLVARKRRLSMALAINGLCLLLPLALLLRDGATGGPLPWLELAAGAVQLGLLAGLARTGRQLRSRRTASPSTA